MTLPFTHVRPLRSCVSDDRSLSERRSDHALVNSIKLIRMIFFFSSSAAFLDGEITRSRYTPTFLSSSAKEIGGPKQRYASQKSFPLQILFSETYCSVHFASVPFSLRRFKYLRINQCSPGINLTISSAFPFSLSLFQKLNRCN